MLKNESGLMAIFDFPVRVYYEDTDAEGVVYYANYLKFFERARTEWLRHLAMPVAQLSQDESLIFVVRRAEVDYFQPARLDDELLVSARLLDKRRTSFNLEQRIFRNGEQLCSGIITLVCLDASEFKPVRIPDKINQLID